MSIDWEKYSTVAFIDSNVALQCLALEQLPWAEVDKKGPILVLIVPKVFQEVESKKNDSRLGDHARRFNRTLRPLLNGNETVDIRTCPAPSVEITFADCGPIQWSEFPNYDSSEADAVVAVQSATAKGPGLNARLVISHDIRPLFLAQKLGLRTFNVGDNWLRPKEQSEAEKKAAKLQREIDLLKSRVPKLELSFDSPVSCVDSYRVSRLSDEERQEVIQAIIDLNPMPKQDRSSVFVTSYLDYDSSLNSRYDRWADEIIPSFVKNYEGSIELNFGQLEIRFHLTNASDVPAENVLVRLTATGGWLNDRYVLASPAGPIAPKARSSAERMMHGIDLRNDLRNLKPVHQGRHEFVVINEPNRATEMEVSCHDFRRDKVYECVIIAWVDPHAEGLRVEATVSASNLHGDARAEIRIANKVTEVAVDDLIDLSSMKFQEVPPLVNLVREKFGHDVFTAVEFDESSWDD